jgi:hypothetical protein
VACKPNVGGQAFVSVALDLDPWDAVSFAFFKDCGPVVPDPTTSGGWSGFGIFCFVYALTAFSYLCSDYLVAYTVSDV